MLDRIEYGLLVALAVAAFLWRNHQRAVRAAEDRGENAPAMATATWELLPPLLALGIGVVAGFTCLMFTFQAGEGWGGIAYFAVAIVVGFFVTGLAWLLLLLLGPVAQVSAAVALAVVFLSVGGLQAFHRVSLQPKAAPAPTAQQVLAAQRDIEETNRKRQGIEHAGEGVVPARYLEVTDLGDVQRVGNLTDQPLFINVNRVLRRRDGSGHDRCLLAVHHYEKGGGGLPRVNLEFKPEVAPGASARFAGDCEDGRFRHAPLEFRVFSADGRTLFMSDTAF